MSKLIYTGKDWSEEKIGESFKHIEEIAKEELGLDYYDPQFEIVDSSRMLDLYASIGMPIMYNHWSFGKHYIQQANAYKRGDMGVALELVINSDPGICYLMDENTMTQQVMVMAHAACGHAAFFKNNVFFKQWTDPGSIIDYLDFAKKYINDCEEKYGYEAVERVLDACHALQDYGVDRYKKPKKISFENESKRQKLREEATQQSLNILWSTIPDDKKKTWSSSYKTYPKEPEENILYFIEKNAPKLEQWQRELVRIVRKIAQYYYPQKQCVTGNHLISTDQGLLRFDELINKDGYIESSDINMLTKGDKFTAASHTYLKRKAKVVKITTATGKVFTGTPEHPLTVIQGSKHVLKDLGEMSTDDYLVVNTNYENIFSKKEPKLIKPEFKEKKITCKLCKMESSTIASHIYQYHHITISEYKEQFDVTRVTADSHRLAKSKVNCKKYPTKMTPELAELLTHIGVASTDDASAASSIFSFLDHDKSRLKRVETLLNNLFGISDLKIVKEPLFNRKMISFSSFTLKSFINANFPEVLSKNICIPKLIRMSTKKSIISYIRAFIDLRAIRRTDVPSFQLPGYFSEREAFNQLQTMLASLGIIAIISESERLTYNGLNKLFDIEPDPNHKCVTETLTLKIHNDYKEQYQRIIGSSDMYWPKYKVTYYTNNDIPGGKKLLEEIRTIIREQIAEYSASTPLTKLSYKHKVNNGMLVKQKFPCMITDIFEVRSPELKQCHVEKYSDKFEKLQYIQNLPQVQELFDLIKISSGVFYDKIVSIEEVEELQDVYDVTIPENHLFWLDNVISHNTKIANEGFATFTHQYIMRRLHEKELIDDGAYMEFLACHSSVVYQPDYSSKHYSGFNPYALGSDILHDIKRICTEPSKEDEEWFPDLIGKNWVDEVKNAAYNYRDESFIQQFLSPTLMRKWKLFKVHDIAKETYMKIDHIHNEDGFKEIRKALAKQNSLGYREPEILVNNVNLNGSRQLFLRHNRYNGVGLNQQQARKVLTNLEFLWGYPASIDSFESIKMLDGSWEERCVVTYDALSTAIRY